MTVFEVGREIDKMLREAMREQRLTASVCDVVRLETHPKDDEVRVVPLVTRKSATYRLIELAARLVQVRSTGVKIVGPWQEEDG